MPLQRKINDVDVRLLRIFKAVAECGGFSAAETELNIARSTISTHMADLEARLGLILCRRGRSGFALTDDGKQVYQACLQLLSALEGFRSQISALHNQLSGELKILCSDAILGDKENFLLTEILRRFAEQAPDVEISIATEVLPEIERALLAGRADIGFIPCHRELGSVSYLPLYQEQYQLYCGKEHPLFETASDAISEDTIKQQRFVHPGIQTNPQASQVINKLQRRATAYHYEARLALLQTGLYIGYFPEHYASELVEQGELKRLNAQRFGYQANIAACFKNNSGNKALSVFCQHLQEAYNLKSAE
ncbi:LysR family transcriptional regulator [Pseudoteredinibacter isoporae]|uniref:DNA-binding transcriptional LysR family regulator n=1 Tax=Pseudoteredinibacter isoporae TaxID=570281 RepID=A0A7X0JWA3_9GAMM|nr:LysR family transcriptional regulator [Pseudoteredinibacter isoporae]MBB6522908.1 DNA-binding transcriptional LysR family regulator [Pseudoteredinibacter isoporae]NHO88434.1 LysR family transcriptional regulator [Pseudoteredinibacter isoporae]NIB23235.1 LysR family transcriptional regulator [Pseudoteredinibacter isoporae]